MATETAMTMKKKEINHVQKNYHKFPEKQHFRKRTDLLELTQKRKTLNLAQRKMTKSYNEKKKHILKNDKKN